MNEMKNNPDARRPTTTTNLPHHDDGPPAQTMAAMAKIGRMPWFHHAGWIN